MKLLKFGAPWCVNCSILSKMMESIEFKAELEIESVDIDEDLATGAKYQVRTLPTLVLLNDDGTEIKRLTSSPKSKAALETWLNS